MEIAIYTLTSTLHDKQAVDAVTQEFLSSLWNSMVLQGIKGIDHVLRTGRFDDYGTHILDLIYVRTGGTEGIFRELLPVLLKKSNRPFYLLTSGKSNSLAASMEILSYLRQRGLKGEILHGSANYISSRIGLLAKVGEARQQMAGCRLGIVGQPSDWLISSQADHEKVKSVLGIELADIPMQELLDAIACHPLGEPSAEEWSLLSTVDCQSKRDMIKGALPGALQIYDALKHLMNKYHLQGFTLRCFDLLTAVHNTGCLALAKLNSEGYVAGCEGDVPAMLSMKIVRSLIGVSGFQANPASINPDTGEMLFAHCTIPLNLLSRYEYDTHFESGIGVGIRGYMPEGPVTIFKVSGDLSRHFIAEGTLIRNQAKPDLCRTQQVIQLLDASQAVYFLNNPIGNHHIVLPGHHRELLEEFINGAS